MNDFPPDGTRVRLVIVNDPTDGYFSEGIVGGETGIFTRADPHGYRADGAGYVALDHPCTSPYGGDFTSQFARPQDMELVIPVARTHARNSSAGWEDRGLK
jgi:hypothetical protein